MENPLPVSFSTEQLTIWQLAPSERTNARAREGHQDGSWSLWGPTLRRDILFSLMWCLLVIRRRSLGPVPAQGKELHKDTNTKGWKSCEVTQNRRRIWRRWCPSYVAQRSQCPAAKAARNPLAAEQAEHLFKCCKGEATPWGTSQCLRRWSQIPLQGLGLGWVIGRHLRKPISLWPGCCWERGPFCDWVSQWILLTGKRGLGRG